MLRGKTVFVALLLLLGLSACGDDGSGGGVFWNDLSDHQGSLDILLEIDNKEQIVAGDLRFSARVYSESTLLGVEFFVDEQRFDTDLVPPYTSTFDSTELSDGQHTFMACGADTGGDRICDDLDVTIDNSPPELSETLPAEGSTLFLEDGPMQMQLIQADLTPLHLVEFRVNGFLVGQFQDPPYVATIEYSSIFVNEAELPKTLLLQFSISDALGQTTDKSYNVTVDKRLALHVTTLGEIWGTARQLSNGNMVFGTTSDIAMCVGADGAQKWSVASEGGNTVATAVASVDDTVFAAGLDGTVRAFGPTGALKWSVNLGTPPGGDLEVFEDRVLVPAYSGSFYQLSRASGATVYKVDLPNYIHSSPAVTGDGTIYVGCQDKNLYALKNNSVLWQAATGGEVWGSPAVSSSGNIYVGSNDGWLYCFDNGGAKLWAVEIKGQMWGRPLVTTDNLVFVGSTSKYLVKLNATTGEKLWEIKLGGITSSSPVMAQDGSLIIGTTSDGLFSLNPADGSVRWSWPTGGAIHATALVRPGRVCYGTANREFFCLRY